MKRFLYFIRGFVRYDFKKYDIRLIVLVLALSIIGIFTINSAADGFVDKQILGLCVGLIAMVFFSLIDYNFIANFQWILYAICILMLIAVILFGINVNGATRWFSLGSFGTLQPSEFAKILVIEEGLEPAASGLTPLRYALPSTIFQISLLRPASQNLSPLFVPSVYVTYTPLSTPLPLTLPLLAPSL